MTSADERGNRAGPLKCTGQAIYGHSALHGALHGPQQPMQCRETGGLTNCVDARPIFAVLNALSGIESLVRCMRFDVYMRVQEIAEKYALCPTDGEIRR